MHLDLAYPRCDGKPTKSGKVLPKRPEFGLMKNIAETMPGPRVLIG